MAELERPPGFPQEQWKRPCAGCDQPWWQHQIHGYPLACNHFSFSAEGAAAAKFWDGEIHRLGLA